VQRLAMPHRLGDAATLRGTWAIFEPGLPLTLAGALAAMAGFLAGAALLPAMLSMLSLPFRRLFGSRA
jgi:hypothetical protein